MKLISTYFQQTPKAAPLIDEVICTYNGYFLEGGLNIGFGLQKQDFDLDGVARSEYDYSFVGDGFITAGSTTPLGGVFGIKFGFASVEPSVDENEFSIATVNASLFYRIRF